MACTGKSSIRPEDFSGFSTRDNYVLFIRMGSIMLLEDEDEDEIDADRDSYVAFGRGTRT